MRRIVLVILSAIFAIILGATAALADSPHFLFANSSLTSSLALKVNFKEAGLGTSVTDTNVGLHVDSASATYQCFNNGGNHPKAGNKETVSHSLDTSGTFPVRNGQTTGSLIVGPPGPGDFSCPNGQHLVLNSVIYSGIFVTGTGTATLEATPDPISGP